MINSGLIFLLVFTANIVLAQDIINSNVLSSSVTNNEAAYTLGEIIINDVSGVLATNSFQLFYSGVVKVSEVTNSNIKVYPNPLSTQIHIDSKIIIKNLKVIDMAGIVIINQSGSSKIDLSTIAAGNYIILINGEKSIQITKQ